MKKIENSFAVTGFIGKDAEIRQFTSSSVAKFSLAVGQRRPLVEKPKEYQLSWLWRFGARTKAHPLSY